MKKLNDFMNRLDKFKIYYKINKIRDESILVEVVIPGERWEVEFMEDDTIVIEKFISDGTIYDKDELAILFRDFTD
jgi:hypothetical protein